MASRRFAYVVGMVVVLAVSGVQADVAVQGLFSDHMVVQRDQSVPVWGTAEAGEKVTVTMAGQSVSAQADAQGHWQVRLAALPVGGPHQMTIAGRNTLTINDVLVGEVWVCSGQSNMAWPLERALEPEREIASADFPKIRLLEVARRPFDEPQTEIDRQWQVCAPETAKEFSAVGYFFGREMHKALGVPIGLIDSSVGGTPAESWTPRPVLDADTDFRPILTRWEQRIAAARVAATQSAPQQAPGDRPAPRLEDLLKSNQRPAVLYNGMIHPLVPYAIRGAIWYQGESNARYAYQYRKLFPAMIGAWRKAWGQGDFPFLFVQLSSWEAGQRQPYRSTWAELREAQTMTLALPATGMAVTTDIGDPKDIHPRNKQEVGRRLALAARALVHGEKIPYSGPMYAAMVVEGDKIRIRFKHTDGGLAVRGEGPLKGFAIAGEDQEFIAAVAVIDGDTVVVRSEKVAHPVAVRYAWADVPDDNLVNGAGLPASPFRTDEWPGLTANER